MHASIVTGTNGIFLVLYVYLNHRLKVTRLIHCLTQYNI